MANYGNATINAIVREKDSEIARLRKERDEHLQLGLVYHRQAVGLKEDNDKLRASLEQIADPLTIKLDTYGTGTKRALEIITALRDIARKALAEQSQERGDGS